MSPKFFQGDGRYGYHHHQHLRSVFFIPCRWLVEVWEGMGVVVRPSVVRAATNVGPYPGDYQESSSSGPPS